VKDSCVFIYFQSYWISIVVVVAVLVGSSTSSSTNNRRRCVSSSITDSVISIKSVASLISVGSRQALVGDKLKMDNKAAGR